MRTGTSKTSANNNAESLEPRWGVKWELAPPRKNMDKKEILINEIDPNAQASFTNFSDEKFTGYWDGKGRGFEPGESKWMPAWTARQFAKVLVNRELLRRGPDNEDGTQGDYIISKGDTMTSPKFPEQFPIFMELFNKAFKLDNSGPAPEEKKNDLDTIINSANRNKEAEAKGLGKESQIVNPPAEDESFEGKPVDDN